MCDQTMFCWVSTACLYLRSRWAGDLSFTLRGNRNTFGKGITCPYDQKSSKHTKQPYALPRQRPTTLCCGQWRKGLICLHCAPPCPRAKRSLALFMMNGDRRLGSPCLMASGQPRCCISSFPTGSRITVQRVRANQSRATKRKL